MEEDCFGVNIGIDNSQDSNLGENELDKIIIEIKPAKIKKVQVRES